MRYLMSRACLVVSLSAVLITAACSSVLNEAGVVAPAARPESEAAPAVEAEPPAAIVEPEPTPTAGSEPTQAATGEAPTTGLRMEIGEPEQGVTPAPPQEGEEPDMPAELGAQAIPQGQAPLAAAINHLAGQTGLPAEQINLISMEAVDWSDTSLGCPQEGYMYAQVITPGYKIVLEAEGVEYEYHTDQGTNVVLCQP